METRNVYEIEDPEEIQELYRTHWWFDGRELDDVRRSLAGSDEVVGLRRVDDGTLVASARVITDYVYTGKVLDVIVDEAVRGQGLGTELMGAITTHPDLREVDELTVNCRSGIAPFYEACGFRVHEMIDRNRSSADEGSGEDYYVMVYS